MNRPEFHLFLSARRVGAVLLAFAALALHACGGGVEGQGTGSVSYSEGPIGGFGSVIVNGVHFDDSQARIVDVDGHTLQSADLKLGMTVQIDAGAIDPASLTAVAQTITVGSDLTGPVSANDLGTSTLTVLGQPVRVTASTVFDDRLAGGQAAVAVGSVVEVFAIYDPVSGVYAARRIEPEPAPSSYRIRGKVSSLDSTAKTFRIGSQVFAYSTAPAEGQITRFQLATTPNGSGQWVVSAQSQGTRTPPDDSDVEIESVISAYTSNADFTVNGLKVDGSAARIEPAGAVLAAGLRVEVEGTMKAGVLVADKVEVKGSGDDGGDDDGGGQEIEIAGRITAIDTSAKTFVVREQTVSYAAAAFEGGTEADLAVDTKVEVKGQLSDDGTVVVADQVKIGD